MDEEEDAASTDSSTNSAEYTEAESENSHQDVYEVAIDDGNSLVADIADNLNLLNVTAVNNLPDNNSILNNNVINNTDVNTVSNNINNDVSNDGPIEVRPSRSDGGYDTAEEI